MKQHYISPETTAVKVKLYSSVLEGAPYADWSKGAYGGDTPGYGDAKKTDFVEEEETLPTQPNLWVDDEEE